MEKPQPKKAQVPEPGQESSLLAPVVIHDPSWTSDSGWPHTQGLLGMCSSGVHSTENPPLPEAHSPAPFLTVPW